MEYYELRCGNVEYLSVPLRFSDIKLLQCYSAIIRNVIYHITGIEPTLGISKIIGVSSVIQENQNIIAFNFAIYNDGAITLTSIRDMRGHWLEEVDVRQNTHKTLKCVFTIPIDIYLVTGNYYPLSELRDELVMLSNLGLENAEIESVVRQRLFEIQE